MEEIPKFVASFLSFMLIFFGLLNIILLPALYHWKHAASTIVVSLG